MVLLINQLINSLIEEKQIKLSIELKTYRQTHVQIIIWNTKNNNNNDLPGHNFIVNFHNTVWITGSSAKDDTQTTRAA